MFRRKSDNKEAEPIFQQNSVENIGSKYQIIVDVRVSKQAFRLAAYFDQQN